jgi:hypothetical protein
MRSVRSILTVGALTFAAVALPCSSSAQADLAGMLMEMQRAAQQQSAGSASYGDALSGPDPFANPYPAPYSDPYASPNPDPYAPAPDPYADLYNQQKQYQAQDAARAEEERQIRQNFERDLMSGRSPGAGNQQAIHEQVLGGGYVAPQPAAPLPSPTNFGAPPSGKRTAGFSMEAYQQQTGRTPAAYSDPTALGVSRGDIYEVAEPAPVRQSTAPAPPPPECGCNFPYVSDLLGFCVLDLNWSSKNPGADPGVKWNVEVCR